MVRPSRGRIFGSNLTGQPAATVCAGVADGMPVGLQLIGRALGKYDVVRAAAALETTQPARRPGI
jgi:aspartyl-tRNA(Asn)/glutamyl-tRNA(Gln) amidotransferase subunit A